MIVCIIVRVRELNGIVCIQDCIRGYNLNQYIVLLIPEIHIRCY